MTSFTSLLNSIGGNKHEAPQTNAAAPGASGTARPQTLTNGARPATNNAVAGVKRKPDEQATSANAKVVKTEVKVPIRPVGPSHTQSPAQKPASSSGASTAPYRGTARPAQSTASTPQKPVPRPIPRSCAAASSASTSTPAAAANGGPAKPKKGYAAVLEKAKAAQEAAKAAGSSTIKHKPVEKLTRRDRQRLQEAEAKQKAGNGPVGKVGKLAVADRSRSGTPVDAKGAKKAPEPTYKGTMKKPTVEKQEFTYKGTMRKADPGRAAKPVVKGQAQDKYGGYADWDELSDAEDPEDEEGYDSEGSSEMMDAGFDDMEAEDRRALAAAKREDQEALEEEERHRREKMERKRKLQALSKSAAAKRKY